MAFVLDADHVVARYDYVPTQPNCIPLVAGTEVTVYNRHESGWWEGATLSGRRGWFPSNFVQPVQQLHDDPEPLPDHIPDRSPESDPRSVPDPDDPEEEVFEDALPHPALRLPSTLLQATYALEDAVRARESASYITCTAAVVTATRNTLEALGCLRRTDTLVQAKPGILFQRKEVLRSLEQLVALSDRLATSDRPPPLPPPPPPLAGGDSPEEDDGMLTALQAVKAALMALMEASVHGCPRPKSRDLMELRSHASDSSLGMLSPHGLPALLAPDLATLPQEAENARSALQHALDEFAALMEEGDKLRASAEQPHCSDAVSKLIDVTLRVHESVRQLLHLVERILNVGSYPGIQSSQMTALATARSDMYRASTQFLALVRWLTSTRNQPDHEQRPSPSAEGRSVASALTDAASRISLALAVRSSRSTITFDSDSDQGACSGNHKGAHVSSLPTSPRPLFERRAPASAAHPVRTRARLSLLTRKVASLSMLRSPSSTSSLASSVNTPLRTPRSPASNANGTLDPVRSPLGLRTGGGMPIPSPDDADFLSGALVAEDKTWSSELDASGVLRNCQGSVLGGTLPGLVSALVAPSSPPVQSTTAAFALTMHLFAQPETVARQLLDKYHTCEGDEVVRANVLSFVRLWLSDQHWRAADAQALPLLRVLAEDAGEEDALSLAELRTVREPVGMRLFATGGIAIRRVVGDEGTAVESLYSRPWVVPGANPLPLKRPVKEGPFTALSANEIARQLTVLSSRLYLSIEPGEFFSPRSPAPGRRPVYAINEELDASLSTPFEEWSRLPSLAALAMLSNRIVGWVAETTLAADSLRERRDVIKHFIKVADKCLALNNFHVFFAVQGGLACASIRRLTHTWSSLASKYTRMASEHAYLVEPRKNYRAYRLRLEAALSRGEPCVPFVGLVLTDLTFALEGNAPTRKATVSLGHRSTSNSSSSEGLDVINWARYARAAKIVLALQGRVYPLQAVDEVLSFLATSLRDAPESGTPEKDERLYRRSLALEPRAPPPVRTTPPYNALGFVAPPG